MSNDPVEILRYQAKNWGRETPSNYVALVTVVLSLHDRMQALEARMVDLPSPAYLASLAAVAVRLMDCIDALEAQLEAKRAA